MESARGCMYIAHGVSTWLRKLASEGRCRAQNPQSSQSENAHDKNGARRALGSPGPGSGAEKDQASKVSGSSGSTTTTTTVWTGIASCLTPCLTSCLTPLRPVLALCSHASAVLVAHTAAPALMHKEVRHILALVSSSNILACKEGSNGACQQAVLADG